MTEEEKPRVRKPPVEVKEISGAEQLALVVAEAGDKLVVIDFFAEWCGPCKVIAPRVTELANIHDDVVFIKINIDDNDEIVDKYEVSSIPTFVFIKGGEKVDYFIGANYEVLVKKVVKHKAPPPEDEAEEQ